MASSLARGFVCGAEAEFSECSRIFIAIPQVMGRGRGGIIGVASQPRLRFTPVGGLTSASHRP